jgi:hypothetical protein
VWGYSEGLLDGVGEGDREEVGLRVEVVFAGFVDDAHHLEL